jgi:transcriptional regulator with XRE-family HTH domain
MSIILYISRPTVYSIQTREAARLLGARVRIARLERRWSIEELADRVGVTRVTMSKVEDGDLSVKLGTALEAATVLGVALFDEDRSRRRLEAARVGDKLALLPETARKPPEVDDDF